MIMLRDFKAMIAGPRWNMSSVYKSGKLCLVSEKSLTLMIMLRDFKAMIAGPRWNMSSVYKSGRTFRLSKLHR